MKIACLVILFASLGALPALAVAQAVTAPVPAPVQTTQNVTVTEPNLDALKMQPASTQTMPRWSEFPLAPTGVPKVAEFARRVQVQEGSRAELQAFGRTIVWEVFEPDAIAAAVHAQIDPAKMGPIDDEMAPAQTEALAQSLREKATPPPVAQ